jgi:hypothetical protein
VLGEQVAEPRRASRAETVRALRQQRHPG